jgi:hypothetical protein
MPHIFSSERPVQRKSRSAGGARAVAGADLVALQAAADGSAVQRRLSGLQDSAVQRMEEEEPLQGKARAGDLDGPVQRLEEEEMLQGKARAGGLDGPVQRLEEEEMMQGKAGPGGLEAPTVQRQAGDAGPAQGGLPTGLRSGIESLSGIGMGDVRVHYNSGKPAQLNAHAYAQGTDIHLASGQEKHLGHEAWHVVQQKQGRVKPTMELDGVSINDDPGLEQEADRMGDKAFQTKPKDNR